ncbi:hypothetical protein AB0K11_24620 [Mycobacterium sp. NPDC050551]|uniref:hypothetical protein n=1 Tax=Mycobacterium sp. NPDC050551 TaxID=3155407 RepID=UPI0034372A79
MAVNEPRSNMTDSEVLAHYRQQYPYIPMGRATEVHRTWLKFRHLGAAVDERQRDVRLREQQRVDELCERRRVEGLSRGR